MHFSGGVILLHNIFSPTFVPQALNVGDKKILTSLVYLMFVFMHTHSSLTFLTLIKPTKQYKKRSLTNAPTRQFKYHSSELHHTYLSLLGDLKMTDTVHLR